jgi:hypothetical protein
MHSGSAIRFDSFTVNGPERRWQIAALRTGATPIAFRTHPVGISPVKAGQHGCGHAAAAMADRRRASWQLNANQFCSGNDAKSLDSGRGSTRFGGEGSYGRREKM